MIFPKNALEPISPRDPIWTAHFEGFDLKLVSRHDPQINADDQPLKATLRKVPPEVVVATGLFMDGDLDAAEALVRGWLLEHGDQVEAMRLLARIGIARKIYDDPELLLAAVLARAPGYRAAREEYARVLEGKEL